MQRALMAAFGFLRLSSAAASIALQQSSRYASALLRSSGKRAVVQNTWATTGGGGSLITAAAVAVAAIHSSACLAASPATKDVSMTSSFSSSSHIKALLIELDGRPGELLHQKVTGETHSSLGGWFQVPDLALKNHYFVVPLDYDSPDGTSISIFAREVVGTGKEEKQLPYLLYLQGGPGFECGRPTEASGWVKKACEEYRVILLDQRGTGLSTPLTTSALSQFSSPKQQASYLQHFRADNIVRDAEYVRNCLVQDDEAWTVLGQSFGGFCAVTYLSMAPGGLRHVLLTGGLPPVDDGCMAETVYRALYKRVVLQNAKFYERFPEDENIVRSIVLHLAEAEAGGVPLPSGGILTPHGLQLLGLTGLGSAGGFERLHYILERAWDPELVTGSKKTLSFTFLRMVENWIAFDTNPLYAIMHEAIYCQGAASKWAAHHVRQELGDQFDAVKSVSNGSRVLFTGEMIFPWMFDEIAALRPLKEVANILAEKADWPPLYNKQLLNANKVPVAAAVYYEDLYVDFSLSQATAAQISGIRLWVTNEYMHSGIREDGSRILDQLFGMIKGKFPLR